MQIIVFGMHRSGTSLITRLINMLGAYAGPEKSSIGFNKDNPKGFWERREVLQMNDALLALHHCRWDALAQWPQEALKPADPQLIRALRGLILDMDAHRPWVLKDPRFCLTFPYFKPHLEVPVAVIAHRNPLETARSLQLRNNMPPDYALALWEYHAVGLLNATYDLPLIHVSHAGALRDPVRFTRHLHEALEREDVRGLRLPSDREILAFIDPALYRAHSEDAPGLTLTPHQEMLESLLKGETVQHAPVELSEASAQRMREGY